MKILMLENIHPDAGAVFAAAGHAVERVPHSPPRKVLVQEKIGRAHRLNSSHRLLSRMPSSA